MWSKRGFLTQKGTPITNPCVQNLLSLSNAAVIHEKEQKYIFSLKTEHADELAQGIAPCTHSSPVLIAPRIHSSPYS